MKEEKIEKIKKIYDSFSAFTETIICKLYAEEGYFRFKELTLEDLYDELEEEDPDNNEPIHFCMKFNNLTVREWVDETRIYKKFDEIFCFVSYKNGIFGSWTYCNFNPTREELRRNFCAPHIDCNCAFVKKLTNQEECCSNNLLYIFEDSYCIGNGKSPVAKNLAQFFKCLDYDDYNEMLNIDSYEAYPQETRDVVDYELSILPYSLRAFFEECYSSSVYNSFLFNTRMKLIEVNDEYFYPSKQILEKMISFLKENRDLYEISENLEISIKNKVKFLLMYNIFNSMQVDELDYIEVKDYYVKKDRIFMADENTNISQEKEVLDTIFTFKGEEKKLTIKPDIEIKDDMVKLKLPLIQLVNGCIKEINNTINKYK